MGTGYNFFIFLYCLYARVIFLGVSRSKATDGADAL